MNLFSATVVLSLLSLGRLQVIESDRRHISSSSTTGNEGGPTSVTWEPEKDSPFFKIEGTVMMPQDPGIPSNWQSYTRVLANYGQHIGFIREDGSFVLNGVRPGSYVVEVANKDYIFEPFRVDVTSKGKLRARKIVYLQPSAVHQVPYPLKFMGRQPAQYFRKREEWKITDMLMNPMIIMMVLPLLLVMVIPKMINTDDPEIQREMQQTLQMPKYDMPELSEVMTNWFGGKKPKPKPRPTSAIKSKR